MDVLKSIEIAFRRVLLRLLGLIIKRGKSVPPGLDFNSVKILFVRQDRIGDVLISTPLIYALKSRYPAAVVDFLLSSNNHFVLAHEPLVRKRWVYRKSAASALRLIRSIRREQYDFVIDLMDNPSTTSTLICALAGGRWNVGLSKQNEYAYDVAVPLLSRKETHIVDRLAVLLTVFGISPEKEKLEVRYVPAADSRRFAQTFFQQRDLRDRFVIGLNVSPAGGVRFWGIQNFRALIQRLLGQFPELPILVLYQPRDKEQAENIAESFKRVVLSPRTDSFDQFAALVQLIGILVTPDTSAVHLAAAFHIPSVVLYVQSNKDLRIWEPYGSPSETIVTDVDDLKTIPADRVFEAVSRLIAKIDAGRARVLTGDGRAS
ncbi:MAG: glycosyltransferase family 9 protein [Ignavibacteria bacterium]|nr:glycosyltransferase family 9 protein [Ignavibacteria bacterium]